MGAVLVLHQVAEVQTEEALPDLLVDWCGRELPILPCALRGRDIAPRPVVPAVCVRVVVDVERVDWVHRPPVRVHRQELAVDRVAELPAVGHPISVGVVVGRVADPGDAVVESVWIDPVNQPGALG